jgi:hypothetical protein
MAEQITRADDERRDRDGRGGTQRQEAVRTVMVGRGRKTSTKAQKASNLAMLMAMRDP